MPSQHGITSPVGEREFVQPDGVGLLLVVAILLIVDRDSIPSRWRRALVVIQRRGLAVQRDGLEQQMIVRCSLNLNQQVVPGVVDGIAGDSCWAPLLSGVVPNMPLMSASDSALVSPDKRLTVNKLIDVELEGLRDTQIGRKEVNVVGEIVDVRNDGVVGIRKTL